MKENQPQEPSQPNRLKLSYWTYIGVASFAMLFGFLIGNSNSPVVGAALTAVVGVLTGFIGIFKSETIFQAQNIWRIVGIFLTVFSIAFITGDLVGIGLRIGYFQDTTKEYPWKNNAAPNSTKDALEWIVLQEELLKKGYSSEQISKLYQEFYSRGRNNPSMVDTTQTILPPELFFKNFDPEMMNHSILTIEIED